MIERLLIKWAERTPEKTAVIHNGRPISYQTFSESVGRARGYLLRRGWHGPGHAVLAVSNLMSFWVISLALRSLGFTTIALPNSAAFFRRSLPNLRCVVTTEGEDWSRVKDHCTSRGIPLLTVSLVDEPVVALDKVENAYSPGGHILLTSGTTGTYKMVLMSPEIDGVLLERKVDLTGMGQASVLGVFNCGAWTGVGYRWAASPWLVGGTTVIQQFHLHQVLSHRNLTHAVLVPSALATVLATPKASFSRNENLRLFVGGGAMTRAQVDEIKSRITPNLYNWLASTEAGGIAVTPVETSDDHRWHRLVPNRVVEIVDDHDNPVPVRIPAMADTGSGDGGHHRSVATQAG